MSPFELRDGRPMPCLGGGVMYPFDHARSCTCPCPTCIDLHRQVLAHVGLLELDAAISHVFVFAHGSLVVAESTGADHGRHYALNDEIREAHEIKEPFRRATIGWLLPTRDRMRLLAVRAASDPHGAAVDHALTQWAHARGRVIDT